MKVIKKPIKVNAWKLPEFSGNDVYNVEKIIRELDKLVPQIVFYKIRLIFISEEYRVTTPEGEMAAHAGDYVVQDEHDYIWVVQKDTFEDTYEVVE